MGRFVREWRGFSFEFTTQMTTPTAIVIREFGFRCRCGAALSLHVRRADLIVGIKLEDGCTSCCSGDVRIDSSIKRGRRGRELVALVIGTSGKGVSGFEPCIPRPPVWRYVIPDAHGSLYRVMMRPSLQKIKQAHVASCSHGPYAIEVGYKRFFYAAYTQDRITRNVKRFRNKLGDDLARLVSGFLGASIDPIFKAAEQWSRYECEKCERNRRR